MANKKQWTVMVYMAGDNNLSEDMVTGLIGMQENLSDSSEISLLVYYDSAAQGFPSVLVDFTINEPKQRYKYLNFGIANAPRPAIKPFGADKVTIYTITDFVEHSVKEHPADNYALIFSGHGDGFQPDNFLRDHNPSSHISVQDLRICLRYMKKHLLGKRNFGVVGFDACVMNTLEVAHEFSGLADYIVGSQGFVPNAGWDFRRIIRRLKKASENGRAISGEDLAEAITNAFINSNKDYAFYSGRSVDIGYANLSKIRFVKNSLDKLGDALVSGLKSPFAAKLLEQLVAFSHLNCQTHLFEQSIDVKDFCSVLDEQCSVVLQQQKRLQDAVPADADTYTVNQIAEISMHVAAVSAACKAVSLKVSQASKCFTLGSEYQYSNGVSVYFPWSYFSFLITLQTYRYFDFAHKRRKRDGRFARENKGRNFVEGLENPIGGWLSFLDTFLKNSLRQPRQTGAGSFYLFEVDPNRLSDDEKLQFELNNLKKFDDPKKFDAPKKFDSPKKFDNPKKFDDPKKLTSSASNSAIGDFGRMMNSPWAPTLWQPSSDVLKIFTEDS